VPQAAAGLATAKTNRLGIAGPAEWVLRVAISLEFAGHGLTAISVHRPWLAFFNAVGLSVEFGERWMPIVGALDFCLAILVLVHPARAILAWMAFWGLWTAFLRPLSGQSMLEFVERGPNFGAPLALLLLRGAPRGWRDWLR
jgi:hypothetical protein